MTSILIADDHDIVRSGLKMVIETQPQWSVVGEASDGKDAILKCIALQPDVVIMDYSLPLINGIEATRQIRARNPAIEVLIFTMHDSEPLIHDLLKSGARGYLLKSDAEHYLIEAITAVAAHKPFFTAKVSETLLEAYLSRADAVEPLLTGRERNVVQLIAEGYSNKGIANVLNISVKTVEAHRASAMRKLNITSAAALVRYAVRNKIIEA
jgi:DNA-binding NarL/FixJ family response regulator